jgi:hypothetical protein
LLLRKENLAVKVGRCFQALLECVREGGAAGEKHGDHNKNESPIQFSPRATREAILQTSAPSCLVSSENDGGLYDAPLSVAPNSCESPKSLVGEYATRPPARRAYYQLISIKALSFVLETDLKVIAFGPAATTCEALCELLW